MQKRNRSKCDIKKMLLILKSDIKNMQFLIKSDMQKMQKILTIKERNYKIDSGDINEKKIL